jgi:alcohol dehydrogenase
MLAHGADLALELSGNPAALDQAIRAVGYGGRVLIGSWYGTKSATLNLGGAFHRNHVQLISSQVSTLAPRWRGRWDKARRFDVAWRMLARHNPAQLITHRFPIKQAADAYRLLDQAGHETVQVVLTY